MVEKGEQNLPDNVTSLHGNKEARSLNVPFAMVSSYAQERRISLDVAMTEYINFAHIMLSGILKGEIALYVIDKKTGDTNEFRIPSSGQLLFPEDIIEVSDLKDTNNVRSFKPKKPDEA